MSTWGRVFAALYDDVCMKRSEQAGLSTLRAELLRDAAGRVLEVGAGTGINLTHYGPQATVTLTEPERPMISRLQRHARAVRPDVMVLRATAEDLPFDDDSFDVAVATLTLCTVPDQAAALREIARVLRPAGTLLFLEHVRSDDPKLARRQDRVNRLNRIVACGCNCNRPTLDALSTAGFTVEHIERSTFPKAPSFVRPLVCGRAKAPDSTPPQQGVRHARLHP